MARDFSLAWLTSAPLPPPQAIALAAELGYDAVGLRILPSAPGVAYDPLLEDPALLRATRAALRECGMRVFDIEIVRIDAGFHTARLQRFLETSAELGAQAVLVAGDDPEPGRLADNFAAFCAAAAARGLAANLEFMPWTAVRDCATAQKIVTASGAENGRVLADALHVARSGTTPDDLRAVPRELLHYAQLCDAPAGIPATHEEMIFAARSERLLPGEGGIDLRAMLAALPPDLPLSLEIPSVSGKQRFGVRAWAQRALQAARALAD